MVWLILVAVLMWILQCLLGVWQFKSFNREFKVLRAEGRVAVGKSKGRIVAGAVVLLCIDADCRIIKGKKMQGLTIFARLRMFDHFNRKNLLDIDRKACEGLDQQTTKAVLNAVENYREFIRQEAEKQKAVTLNPERI